jgi:hypothetical protein
MECGKERLKLSDRADVLKSLLEELGDMARTIYEEEAIKKQIELAAPDSAGHAVRRKFGSLQLLL